MRWVAVRPRRRQVSKMVPAAAASPVQQHAGQIEEMTAHKMPTASSAFSELGGEASLLDGRWHAGPPHRE